VLDRRLAEAEYLAGSYSIADMATWPWISRFEWQGIDWRNYPDLEVWYRKIAARKAVQRGYDVPTHVNDIPLPPLD
jgi:GST-like protein